MKVSIIMLITCLMFSLSSNGSASERELTAIEVAKKYFEGLISGNADLANEHSDVPFYFDGKNIIREKEKLDQMHRDIAEQKGKRRIPKYKIGNAKKFEKLDESIFPEYQVFQIRIQGDDEFINIYVTKGAGPKVIGFRD